MAGRRWDVDIRYPIDFDRPDWQSLVQNLRPPQWIDYFIFRRGLLLRQIPDFLIGCSGWDNWLLWFARSTGAQLIDASAVIRAVHQNHDYEYHPKGIEGVCQDEEALRNWRVRRWRCALLQTERVPHRPSHSQQGMP